MFAILWTGAFVSNIGTWMETVGVGILVTEATDAVDLDRARRRRRVRAARGARPGRRRARRPAARASACCSSRRRSRRSSPRTLTVLVATGDPGPGDRHADRVRAPAASRRSASPRTRRCSRTSSPRRTWSARSRSRSAQWNLGRVVGPALAGVMIAIGGYEWAFAFNAAELPRGDLRGHPAPAPAAGRAPGGSRSAREIREGLAYVRRDPGLRVVVAYMVVNTLLAAPFIALVPAMAEKVFDAGAERHRGPRHRAGHRRGDDGAVARRARGALRQRPRAARWCCGGCRPRSSSTR